MALSKLLVSVLRGYPAFLTELINTDSKKEKFKDYLVDMKDYYQEKMEEKTGIEMDKINVGLSSELALNFAYDRSIEALEKYSGFNVLYFLTMASLVARHSSSAVKPLEDMTGSICISTPADPAGTIVPFSRRSPVPLIIKG